jgi:hypothetical protein
MDIEGLGIAVAEQLINAGLISSAGDLYYLKAEKVEKLDRMGKKSANNLIEEIENSKSRGLSRLLYALGIRQVGQKAAKVLAEYFGTLEATRYSKQYPDCARFIIKYKFGTVPVSIKKTEIVNGIIYDENLQKLKGINIPIYVMNEGFAGGPVIGSIKKALKELNKISDC